MAGNQQMPRVDMSKEFSKLTDAEKHFVRKIEGMNKNRAVGKNVMKTRNRVTGALLGLGVLGIYIYTIKAVKQEKFLDDFDEIPPTQSKSV